MDVCMYLIKEGGHMHRILCGDVGCTFVGVLNKTIHFLSVYVGLYTHTYVFINFYYSLCE